MAIRFISKATIKNKLVRYSNIWDGTAVYNSFTLVGNYDALATVIVPSGGVSSITFAGIPQTGYAHLQIRYTGKSDRTNVSLDELNLAINGATSTYNSHVLWGDGASTYGTSLSGGTYMQLGYGFFGSSQTIGQPSSGIVDIIDYANTNKNKVVRTLNGVDNNGGSSNPNFPGRIGLSSGLWQSTSAINSLTFTLAAGNFTQYSTFALYGVK